MAGIAFGLFYKLPQYYDNADTWRFYNLSLRETDWLLNDPIAFIKDLFTYGYANVGNIFSGSDSYWNDLKSNLLVKLMAVMNVLTHNSYYTNIILFNFLFIFGLVGIYSVFITIFPGKKWLLIAGIFLLPSPLFWCSGIHKDGLLLSATGMTFYFFFRWLQTPRSKFKYVVFINLLLLIIFGLRNYVALALLPALVCWGFSHKFKRHKLAIFTSVYAVGLVLFFALPALFDELDFPNFIATKQHEFLVLKGGSAIDVEQLQPSLNSFIRYFPNAFDMAFLRPHLNEAKNFSYLPAIAEVLAFMLFLLLCLVFRRRTKPLDPAVYFCFFFGISVLIITGYTITFSGAVVRYRSFVFPFLITPLLCMIDLQFLKKTKSLRVVD